MDWYKSRGYLHFDQPIGLKKAQRIVTNPNSVASHAFKPLLGYEIVTRKIFKEEGKIKSKPKERPIKFAAHVDSHIYSYYCSILTDFYEHQLSKYGLEKSVLAFRKLGKSNIDFAFEAFQKIRSMGECTAIGFDITGFFDNLDHALLKHSWTRLLEADNLPKDHYAVYRSLTKYSEANRTKVFEALGISLNNPAAGRRKVCTPAEFRNIIRKNDLITTNKKLCGIPQGSPISAFLSNLYMLEFDRKVHTVIDEIGGTYFRYCDDMLFVVPSEWKDDVEKIVLQEIEKLRLDINPDKTEICEFHNRAGILTTRKPLQYLGFLFDGHQVLLRSAGLARYSERMNRGVRLAKKTQLKRNKIRADKGLPPTDLFKRKLYATYSHLGRRNFIRYGLNAARVMNSKAIKRQLKPLWRKLREVIERE